MYRLPRPNMAVNDPRVSDKSGKLIRRFQMWNTWDINPTETASHIVEWVANVARSAPGGKLRNLVLSGHGTPASLQVGQGFNTANIDLFDAWSGLVEKIWLPNCRVASIPPNQAGSAKDGNVFCSSLAKKIGGYVVAPTEVQCETVITVPVDMMTSFEGLVLCYGPDGNVSWSHRNPSSYTGASGQCVKVPD